MVVPLIRLSGGGTGVDFYLLLDRDKTPQDLVSVSQALTRLRRSGMTVTLSSYNILKEPVVGQGEWGPVNTPVCKHLGLQFLLTLGEKDQLEKL